MHSKIKGLAFPQWKLKLCYFSWVWVIIFLWSPLEFNKATDGWMIYQTYPCFVGWATKKPIWISGPSWTSSSRCGLLPDFFRAATVALYSPAETHEALKFSQYAFTSSGSKHRFNPAEIKFVGSTQLSILCPTHSHAEFMFNSRACVHETSESTGADVSSLSLLTPCL